MKTEAEYQRLLQQASTERDPKKRQTLIDELNRLLLEEQQRLLHDLLMRPDFVSTKKKGPRRSF